MKILLISDTHMYNDIFEKITERYKDKVDLMIHCGDSSLDADSPLLKDYIVVKGNHDEDVFPHEVIMDKIFITHGQYYNVYAGYNELVDACKLNHCTYCFHGHTHVPTHQFIDGIYFINPGSTMINRGSYGYGTFAIVELNEDIQVTYYNSETFEEVPPSILEEGLETLAEFKKLVGKIRK